MLVHQRPFCVSSGFPGAPARSSPLSKNFRKKLLPGCAVVAVHTYLDLGASSHGFSVVLRRCLSWRFSLNLFVS